LSYIEKPTKRKNTNNTIYIYIEIKVKTKTKQKYHIIGDKMPHCRNKIKKKKSSSVGTDPKSFRKIVETGVKWKHLAHTHIYIHDISIS